MVEATLEALLESLGGRSAAEIEALIGSSVNAGAVSDSALLAAYLASKLSAGTT